MSEPRQGDDPYRAAVAALVAAADDLAGYASYAEIVGAVGHNRPQIRAACDATFEALARLRRLDDEEEDR